MFHKVVDMYQYKCRDCGKISVSGCDFPNIEKKLLGENVQTVVDPLRTPWFRCPKCESQNIYNLNETTERMIVSESL